MKTEAATSEEKVEDTTTSVSAKETPAPKHRGPWKSPLKKHVSSTFIPMIGQYMSEEQLSSHLQKQLLIEREKYEEPEPEQPSEEEKRRLERKLARQHKKKHAGHHGSIISSSMSNMSIKAMSEVSEEDERDLEKVRLRDQARSRMLDDLEMLRDYYKKIYKKALDDKVTNQRKELRERQQKADKKERWKQEKEEKAKHKVVIRLPKSEVKNDLSFKQQIPETGYHKIIRLEHQLKKEGYLSKASETKAFWDYIMVAGNLQQVLEKGQFQWSDILEYKKQHRTRSQSPDPATSSRTWAVTNVDEMLAANVPARNWRSTAHARTTMFSPSGLTDISSSRSGRQTAVTSPASKVTSTASKLKSAKTSNAAQTIEHMFPKVEFPQLAAYQLVFGEEDADPEEIAKEMELQRRLDLRRETRSKLITMFSRALANRAATQRLMEKNAEYSFDKLLDTTSVRDIMSAHDTDSLRGKTPLTVGALEAHDQTHRTLESEQRSGDEPSLTTGTGTRNSTSLSQELGSEGERASRLLHQRLPSIPVPLTMEVASERFPVKEAKGLSTLWVNPF